MYNVKKVVLVLFSVMLTIMFMLGVAINYQSETAQGFIKAQNSSW